MLSGVRLPGDLALVPGDPPRGSIPTQPFVPYTGRRSRWGVVDRWKGRWLGLRFPAWCSLSIGVLMFAQWSFFLVSGQVPEIRTAPIALAFHLAAEAATALALIVAGILLLRGHRYGIAVGLVANGMLIYTVIVSPGYFAQLGQWPLVGLFATLLSLALASVVRLARAAHA
jgi:hypothetical protein